MFTKLGFTLVELIIVLAILGVLIAAGTFSYSSNIRNSRDARRKVDLEQLRAELELRKSSDPNASYPYNIDDLLSTFIDPLPSNTSYSYTPYSCNIKANPDTYNDCKNACDSSDPANPCVDYMLEAILEVDPPGPASKRYRVSSNGKL